ncbi:HD domain-containing protein [Thermosulfuriphilus sp.]
MKVPKLDEALEILDHFGVPEHIKRHCQKVAQVAVFLGRALNQAGEDLDLGLLEVSGLLHDLTKHQSLITGENHALSAAQRLRELGYPEVARVVEEHIFLRPRPAKAPIDEAEIVYYADKRVMHDRIVELGERFTDLLRRYGRDEASLQRIKDQEAFSRKLEERIFSRLAFGPEEVAEIEKD